MLPNDSLSFGSLDSSGYLPPNSLFVSLTSTNKSPFQMSCNKPYMGSKLEMVCLLQGAQIERLNARIAEYEIREKEEARRSLDPQAYGMQIKERSQIASRNDALEDCLQKKYRKSLLAIDSLLRDNEKLQGQVDSLERDLASLEVSNQRAQKQRIRQCQAYRAQCDETSEEVSLLRNEQQISNNLLSIEKKCNLRLQEESESNLNLLASLRKTIADKEDHFHHLKNSYEDSLQRLKHDASTLEATLHQKEQACSTLQRQYATLRIDYQELSHQNTNIHAKYREVEEALKSKASEAASLGSLKNQLSRVKSDYMWRSKELQEEVRCKSMEVEQCKQLLEQYLRRRNELQERCESIEREAQANHNKFLSLAKENVGMAQQLQQKRIIEDELNGSLTRAASELATVRKDCDQLVSAKQNELRSYAARTDAQLTEQVYQLQKSQQECLRISREYASIQQDNRELREENIQLQDEAFRLRSEVDTLKRDNTLRSQSVSSLIGEMANLKQSLLLKTNESWRSAEQAHELRLSIENLIAEIREGATNSLRLDAFLEQTQAVKAQTNAKIERAQQSTRDLCSLVEGLNFQRALELKEEELRELREDLNMDKSLKHQIKDILAKVVSLTRENAQLQQELSLKNIDFQSKLTVHETQRRQLLHKIKAKQEEQASLEQLLATQRKVNHERQVQQERSVVMALEEQVAAKSRAITELRGGNLELVAQLSDVRTTLEEANKCISQRSRELGQVSREKQQCQRDLHMVRQELMESKESLKRSKEEAKQLRRQNTSTNAQCLSLGEQILSLSQQVSKYKSFELKLQAAMGQVAQMQEAMKECSALSKSEREQMQSQMSSMQQQIDNCHHYLQIYEQKIQALTEIKQAQSEQNYQMKCGNYEMQIEVQRLRRTESETKALNAEIDRLQSQNGCLTALTEQLSTCLMQYNPQHQHEQQTMQFRQIYVLLSAEVESLRSRVPN